MGATAQTKGCGLVDYSDPARSMLTCEDGFTLTAEKGSVYTLIDQDRDGRPDAAELKSRTLLIKSPARKGGVFQVRTPHADNTIERSNTFLSALGCDEVSECSFKITDTYDASDLDMSDRIVVLT
ncbi:hypothetical protein [Methylobacterium sp. 10]|uniref:hypothetical protein n=1 Tax=Methylobacterium sp. 10 TaxID=1101191 RepID=UPI0004B9DF3D|nr:hypothetical protein [Methylobacterium sp. 10]